MADAVLVPLGGRLLPQAVPDPEPGEPSLLFEVEILVRIVLSSPVAPGFFPRPHQPDRPAIVSVEDVELGVSDWRQLADREVVIPADAEMDAAVYLAGVHNPVRLRRLRFGPAGAWSIPAEVELRLDFRYVNPRPPELPKALDVCWQVVFDVVPDAEPGAAADGGA